MSYIRHKRKKIFYKTYIKGVAKQELKKLAPKAEELIKKKLPKNAQKKAGDALKKLFK